MSRVKLFARSGRVVAAVLLVAVVVVHVLSARGGWIWNLSYLAPMAVATVHAWRGARRTSREHRDVPVLVATGVTLSFSADLVWTILDVLGVDNQVSVADLLWFAAYAVLCAALWRVITSRRPGGRMEVTALVDVMTVVAVSVLVFWCLSVDSILDRPHLSTWVRTVWSGYPVGDALLLALAARTLVSRTARAHVGAAFVGGVVAWLVADVLYLAVPERGTAQLVMDAGWMVAPVLLAQVTWRPARGSAPSGRTSRRRTARVLVAVAPVLVAPVLDLVADLRGVPDHSLELFVGTLVLAALSFVRVAHLFGAEEQARVEVASARDLAVEASRAKSTFLANVSHEVRTPLTSVVAAAEMLADTDLDEEQAMLVERVERGGRVLGRLVEEVLDFSALGSGRLVVRRRPYDLPQLVEDVVEMFRPRAERAGVALAHRVDPGAPRWVVGDERRLVQVLANLLDNAFKFTRAGTVELAVRATPLLADATSPDTVVGAGFEVAVVDTGLGIPCHEHAHVFEAFHQVDGSTTREHGGTGLGLAVCAELTRLMGGTLRLSSLSGVGSTFTVTLPVGDLTGVPAPTAEPAPLPAVEGSATPAGERAGTTAGCAPQQDLVGGVPS